MLNNRDSNDACRRLPSEGTATPSNAVDRMVGSASGRRNRANCIGDERGKRSAQGSASGPRCRSKGSAKARYSRWFCPQGAWHRKKEVGTRRLAAREEMAGASGRTHMAASHASNRGISRNSPKPPRPATHTLVPAAILLQSPRANVWHGTYTTEPHHEQITTYDNHEAATAYLR